MTYSNRYYTQHNERIRATRAQYYKKYKERIRVTQAQHYKEHRELIVVKRREARKQPINRAQSILAAHRKRGNALQVSPEWVAKFLDKGCPVFDIPYRPAATGQGMDSPTVDHFYPNGGNDESNLWVISRLANTMKSNGTLDQVIKLVGWWSIVEHFQRTLTDKEFFKIRDTMNERLKQTIKTTVEEARRCLSSNSNNASAAKPLKKKSSAVSSKPLKVPRRAAKTQSSSVPAAVRSKKLSSAALRPSALGVTEKEA